MPETVPTDHDRISAKPRSKNNKIRNKISIAELDRLFFGQTYLPGAAGL
jgi:hypothetical protein